MSSLKSMTVGRQVLFAFSVMVLVLVASTLSGLWKIDSANSITQRVIELRFPSQTAGLRLEAGILRSLAELRGYLILGEADFEQRRVAAWNDDIDPALERLQLLSNDWADAGARRRLAEVSDLVDGFRVIQQQVATVAFSDEDTPGSRVLEGEIRPGGAALEEALAQLAEQSTGSPGTAEAVARLQSVVEKSIPALEVYAVAGGQAKRDRFDTLWREQLALLDGLGSGGRADPTALRAVREEQRRLTGAVDRLIELRADARWRVSTSLLADEAAPVVQKILEGLAEVRAVQNDRTVEDSRAAASELSGLLTLQWILLALGLVFSCLLCFFITRSITQRISVETGSLKSASLELQAASSQLLSGSTEQSSATTEFSATIKELTGAASQIVERCSQMTTQSEQAVERCREGGESVREAREVTDAIKAQIENVVQHMLDLGSKSQEIGLVADVITELAEQTTILSYNAAIEAAAAGEAGQSFAVVAEQVGKLSDRAKEAVGEVRALIEEIQRSSNTTIMATEDGLKAAERGRVVQVEVSEKMDLIVGDIENTLESITEVEISATQQSLAANQVKDGIDGVATAAKQFEMSARQCLEMAENLSRSATSLEAI